MYTTSTDFIQLVKKQQEEHDITKVELELETQNKNQLRDLVNDYAAHVSSLKRRLHLQQQELQHLKQKVTCSYSVTGMLFCLSIILFLTENTLYVLCPMYLVTLGVSYNLYTSVHLKQKEFAQTLKQFTGAPPVDLAKITHDLVYCL